MKRPTRWMLKGLIGVIVGSMLFFPAPSAQAQGYDYAVGGDRLPIVVTAGVTPLDGSWLINGGVGIRIQEGLYAVGGGGFGSVQVDNEHGIPIEQSLTSYGIGLFYQLSDSFAVGNLVEGAELLVGASVGLLEAEGEIAGANWSRSRSTTFGAVLIGLKFGPALLSGGVGMPLAD